MPKDTLPPKILRATELLAESMRPYQEALSIIGAHPTLDSVSESICPDRIGMIEDVKQILLGDQPLQPLSDMLTTAHELSGIQAEVEILGASYDRLLKPDVYVISNEEINQLVSPISAYDISLSSQTEIEPLLHASTNIDTSWLQGTSSWLVDKSVLSALSIDSIKGLDTTFSRLCELERETSLLHGIPEALTTPVSN